jgi:hypothetical protein
MSDNKKKKESREVGKGEGWRKGTNYKKYRDNYDAIFKKDKNVKINAKSV